MILGASTFQVAAIRKAIDLGYYVITVDYLPDNIGHTFSHMHVNASTIDVNSVTEAARAHQIDGIFTMASDIALPTVARVAKELHLRGPDEALVEIMTQKNRFRQFQTSLGLDCPSFIEVGNFNHAIADWPGGPAVVKPAVSSGSRGVAKLDKVNTASRVLFESARDYSYTDKVCIEEYIDGRDICVEGFVLNGVIQYAFITEKHVQEFAVIGHQMPCNLNSKCREQIIEQLQVIVTATGYESGPFDADFRISLTRAVLLEMTPRLGGNGVPILVEAVHGVSLIELSILDAMGDLLPKMGTPKASRTSPSASILLRSTRSGIVSSIVTEQMLRSNITGVDELVINLTPGQHVERFAHGGHVFGYCIVDMPEGIKFEYMADLVLNALDIRL